MKLKSNKQTITKTTEVEVYEVPLPMLLDLGSISLEYDPDPDDLAQDLIYLSAAKEPEYDTLLKVTYDGKELDMDKLVFHIANTSSF